MFPKISENICFVLYIRGTTKKLWPCIWSNVFRNVLRWQQSDKIRATKQQHNIKEKHVKLCWSYLSLRNKVREFLHREVVSEIKLPRLGSSDASTRWFLLPPVPIRGLWWQMVGLPLRGILTVCETQVVAWIRWKKKSPKPTSAKREEQ